MHIRAIILILLAALPLEARRRAVELPAIPAAAIDAVIAEKLRQGVPGMSVAIARGNAIVHTAAQGVLENDAPARADSVYRIGSVSKQFAAAAIMKLEERGALRITDSIDAIVPELAGRGIRIEHLLHHSSGLPDATFLTSAYEPFTRAEYLARLAALAMESEPGRVFKYRNTGYYVLAVIVERISGMPYAQFLHDELFAPLGLTSMSVCGAEGPDGFGVDLATGARELLPAADASILLGAGDVCSSATDLARWTHALVSGRAVSRASYERMVTPSPLPTGYTYRYGYGLIIDRERSNPVVMHDGLILGFQSFLLYYPEHDLTIAVLGNGIANLEWFPATVAAIQIGRLLVPVR